MDLHIALILGVGGLATGAIYVLMALGLVLIFSVTRVVFVPFGDVAVFAAFSLAALESHHVPRTIGLVVVAVVVALTVEIVHLLRGHKAGSIGRALLMWGVLPLLPCAVAYFVAKAHAPALMNVVASILLVVPLGPLLGRIVFQPIEDASVLVLLIVALALSFFMSGMGLIFFGPEGIRTQPLVGGSLDLGHGFTVDGQTAAMIGSAIVLSLVFFLVFQRTVLGKALRATAVNRTGARLVGIRPAKTAMLAYGGGSLLAGFIGVLVAPVTTIYYDSGFIMSLKAFVAAIIGGLVSYPVAAVGAVGVGIFESFASFWSGAMKDVIVFGLIIPVLLIRSQMQHAKEEEIEEI